MLGGATRKAFTYGKRGYTPSNSSKKLDESDEEPTNERPKSTIFLPSQVKKSVAVRSLASNTGTAKLFTSPKKVVKSQTTARKSNSHFVKSVPTHTYLHQPAPKKASLASVFSPEKRRKDRSRVTLADVSLASPRKVSVEILTTDDHDHQIARSHRTIRPTPLSQMRIPPNDANKTSQHHEGFPKQHSVAHDPFASLLNPDDQLRSQQFPAYKRSQSDAKSLPRPPTPSKKTLKSSTPPVIIDLTSPSHDAEDRTPPRLKPLAQRVSRTKNRRTVIISSDSSDEEAEATIHKPSTVPKVEASAPRSRSRKPAAGTLATDVPAGSNGRVKLEKEVAHRLASVDMGTTKQRASRKLKGLTPSLARDRQFHGSSLLPAGFMGHDNLSNSGLEMSFAALDLSGSIDDAHDQQQLNQAFLAPLLAECRQNCPHDFNTFVQTFSNNPVLQQSLQKTELRYQKIGEASYSEVFGIGPVVLKIVPLRDGTAPPLESQDDDTPPPSDAEDVLKEILVTKSISETCGAGFARLITSCIVQGKYPSRLLRLWDEYDARKGSESVRPDGFSASQTYAIIVMPNGGPDLESFIFQEGSTTGWQQASSIFWQVTKAVARAETLVRFEHRDLHWGQILIHYANDNVAADSSLHITIIDFGFARMDVQDGTKKITKWTQLDEEIFEGEGEYQYDVYRMMRRHNGDIWDTYCPLTNVMWLHYLLQKLMNDKGLRAPRNSASATTERKAYERLVYVEQVLNACLLPLKAQTTSRRRSIAPKKTTAQWPASAGDLLKFALSKGWTRS